MAGTGVLPTLGRTLVQDRTCLVRKSPRRGQRPLGRSRTARAAAAPSTLQQASRPGKDSREPTLPRRSHTTTSARSGRWVLTPAPASCVTSPQVLAWCFIASRCPRCLEVHGRLCPSVVLGRVAASLYVWFFWMSPQPDPYPHIPISIFLLQLRASPAARLHHSKASTASGSVVAHCTGCFGIIAASGSLHRPLAYPHHFPRPRFIHCPNLTDKHVFVLP